MQQKFFIKPFAELGDRETVPNDTQITGDISYEQGYGYDYQRDQATDPLAKPIERTKLNAILHDITGVLQQYQVIGTPVWATKADSDGHQFPYAQCARVLYRAKETDQWEVYQSLVDNNTAPPSDTDKWRRIVSAIASEEQAIAGTDNSTMMTPLRVAQAVKEFTKEVGQIVFEPRTTALLGYLKCNGALVKRVDYPALWNYAQQSGALVEDSQWYQDYHGSFSAGDGATTFRIPNLGGEFIRCWDDGRGVDSGRAIGTLQSSQNLSHSHGASASDVDDHAHKARTDTQGWHDHGVNDPGHSHSTQVPYGGNGGGQVAVVGPYAVSGYYNTNEARTGIWLNGNGNHTHDVEIENAGGHSHTITVNSDGGNEARPRNISLLALIRY